MTNRTTGQLPLFVFLLFTAAGLSEPLFGQSSLGDCSFRANPSEFLQRESRIRSDAFESVRRFAAKGRVSAAADAVSEPPARRNFIDDEIFDRLAAAGVAPARLSTDAEFVRRIYLDLTGKVPSPAAVWEFLASTDPDKRYLLSDKLLASREFTDKWTVWFADLVQNTERLSTNNRAPQIEGRNSLDVFLREGVSNNKSVARIVTELLTGTGNNYYLENGPANYAVLASTAMGPAQDTYDMMMSRSASQFLGMGHYDCLLCHNGRGHLTGLTLWGETAVRSDAWRMAAHFARMRLPSGAPSDAQQYAHVLYNSTNVNDVATGGYDLNTTYGNRPNRYPIGTEKTLTPEYRDGTKAASTGVNWRQAYAARLTKDPMFGRNFANRIWKQFFGLGLVDPVDQLDPARLDPANPPPAPWTLQATHPALLEKLAASFLQNDTSLRVLIRTIVNSSAYQFSSDYDGEWKYEYLTLFARHYPRRLMAEEIHDAITDVTGVPASYTWPIVNGQTIAQGTALPQSPAVNTAFRLPDVNEPRNNSAGLTFLRTFLRGNRDTSFRSQSGSMQQQLLMLNDAFVQNRIRMSASPVLQEVAKITDKGQLVDAMFLQILARMPSEKEKATAVAFIAPSGAARNTSIEDLAWACLNKFDFLFSY